MSDTIIDMPKVTQMLDAGWRIVMFKNPLGSYSAEASHPERKIVRRTRERLVDAAKEHEESAAAAIEYVDDMHFDGRHLVTDDFTPEQAITRLAYKAVDGKIL